MSVDIFLLGASPDAWTDLVSVLSALPREVAIPIVVLLPQREVADELCFELGRDCALPVEELADKDELVPGRIHVAPAGYHLLIDRGCVALSKEPPIDQQRPSFAPMFETAADSYGEAAAGLVLTGLAGRHCESLQALHARGSAVALGWVSDSERAPAVGGVPVLSRGTLSPWVLEMCTSLSLRTTPRIEQRTDRVRP